MYSFCFKSISRQFSDTDVYDELQSVLLTFFSNKENGLFSSSKCNIYPSIFENEMKYHISLQRCCLKRKLDFQRERHGNKGRKNFDCLRKVCQPETRPSKQG